MYDEAVLREIRPDDLPQEYQALIDMLRESQATDPVRIALLVGQQCGGLCYPLRKIDSAVNAARRRIILREIAAGRPYGDIARRYNLSEQAVRDIHKAQRDEKRQPRLFLKDD